MFSKFLSTTAVALLAAQLVSAQTFTACDPMKQSCPADPAFGQDTVVVDFTKGASDFFDVAPGTTLKYDGKGAAFTIGKETEAPTITSNKYLFFGRVDVELQVSPGTGIVTAFVLQSDDRDEIDWEFLGGDTVQGQTNYFGKGDDTTFNNGGFSPVANPQTTVHTYSVDWTKDYVHWLIDDVVVRELKYADAQGGSRFPQTPCQIKLGTWDGGSSTSPKGTVQWAGGYTDFSKGPFTAYYKKVTIKDYANGVAGAKEYVWSSGSDGSYGSIQVKTTGGDVSTSTSSSTKSGSTQKSTSTNASSSTSSDATKTSMTTMITSTSTSTSTAVHNASQTGATTTESGSTSTVSSFASTTSVLTGAAFKPVFSGALAGAGLLAALIL